VSDPAKACARRRPRSEDCEPSESSFVRNDSRGVVSSFGSTPTTRQPGDNARAAIPLPDSRPPPPHGTNKKSTPRFFEQLDCGRALAGDDVGVIVRRDQRQAALGGQSASNLFAIFAMAVVQDDFAAVSLGRRSLDRRRVVRHDDDARDVEQAAREQATHLRVIA